MCWALIDKLNADWRKHGIALEDWVTRESRTLFEYVGCRECKSLVEAWGEYRQFGDVKITNGNCRFLKFDEFIKK